MKLNLLQLLFLLILPNFCFSQGLITDEKANQEYKKIRSKNTSLLADSNSLPDTIDHSKYLPSIINQKAFGTCVGVATTYYMRTLLEAQRLGITDKSKIDQLRFSPSYLFNAVKDSTNLDCMKGINLTNALTYLKTKGVVNYDEVPYHTCQNNDFTKHPNNSSKIMDFIRVFGAGDNKYEDPVELTKKALSENTPVLVGFFMSPSFDKLKFWNSLWPRFKAFLGFELDEDEDFRLWKLVKGEPLMAGHCVCIVGYNNNKYGGAFKVVNSYGDSWGDNGFFWIKYSDYPKLAQYCFQAYLEPDLKPAKSELSANVIIRFGTTSIDNEVPYMRVFSDNKIDSSKQIGTYSLLYPQNTGTLFIHEANITNQCYLYLIGKNESSLETPLLFPNIDSTSELIGANSKFLFPSPEWNKEKTASKERAYKLIEPLGKENWLFLFSKKKLNITDYISKINAANGPFTKRVVDAFGEELVPYNQINYNDKKIAFDLRKGHKGSIVPILITFDHMELIESF